MQEHWIYIYICVYTIWNWSYMYSNYYSICVSFWEIYYQKILVSVNDELHVLRLYMLIRYCSVIIIIQIPTKRCYTHRITNTHESVGLRVYENMMAAHNLGFRIYWKSTALKTCLSPRKQLRLKKLLNIQININQVFNLNRLEGGNAVYMHPGTIEDIWCYKSKTSNSTKWVIVKKLWIYYAKWVAVYDF